MDNSPQRPPPPSPSFAFPYPSPSLPPSALSASPSPLGSPSSSSSSSPSLSPSPHLHSRPTLPASPTPAHASSSVLARSHSPSAHQLRHHHQPPQTPSQERRPRDHAYRRKAELRAEKLVLVLVGLPARGKSYIAHKLVSYLNWTGRRARLFNVGAFRRQAVDLPDTTPTPQLQPSAPAPDTKMRHDSEFFSHTNERARALRDELAFTVLDLLLEWLDEDGDVAVFDATNTTKERRHGVFDRCRAHSRFINVNFIESICDDKQVLESNFLQKIRNSPDYRNMPEEEAVKDLRARISNYESVYETVEDDEQLSYIKLINLQSKVICYRIYGKVAQKIVGFLMAIHTGDRPIWLTRAGHCDGVEDLDPLQDGHEEGPNGTTDEVEGEEDEGIRHSGGRPKLVSSDMPHSSSKPQAKFPSIASMTAILSPAGQEYARRLGEFVADFTQKKCADCRVDETVQCPVLVYTSTLPRALETVRALPVPPHCVERSSGLKMINTGVCSGKSVQEMREQMPSEWASWRADPFRYRFAGGESYKDVVQNVEPLVLDLERQTTPILVVSHLSTLQVLFGYFVGCPVDRFASLSLPRHTVVQLTPNQYGWKVDLVPLGPFLHGDISKEDEELELSTITGDQQQHPFYGQQQQPQHDDVQQGATRPPHHDHSIAGEGSAV